MNTHQTNTNRHGIRTRGRVPPDHYTVFAVCLTLLLAAAPFNAAFAQAPGKTCGEGNGSGADIRGCFDSLLDEQTRSIDLLDELTQELATTNALSAQEMNNNKMQLEFMRSRNSRGKNDSTDTTEDEFATFANKSGKKSDCDFELHPKFAQGPDKTCTDQDRMENMCREVCKFNDNEKGRNNKRALQTEEEFAEVLEHTKMANDMLEDEMASMTTLVAAFALGDDDPCAAINPHPLLGEPFPQGYMMAMEQMNAATVMLDAISHNFCNQTVAGFDGSTICAVSSAATGISTMLIKYIFRINGDFAGAVRNATLECARTINGDIGQIDAELEKLSQDMDELKSMLGEINTLLNTPQGLRTNFPTR